MTSSEGFQWTQATGLRPGLPTVGYIARPTLLKRGSGLYDVVVAGAGYAGLVAARDLALQGKQVLLLEARDRIGGRTWSTNLDGYSYELGGTWINWKQPNVYAEVSRYDLADELVVSQDFSQGSNYFTLVTNGSRNMSHEEEEKLMAVGITAFCDIDGNLGRTVIPFPHKPNYNHPEVVKWEKMSCRERLAQVSSDLTPDEVAMLESLLLHISGGTLDNTGVFEILKWWSLSDYTPTGISEYGMTYKLKSGQSALAYAIFAEAVATGNLSYKFSCPIKRIKDTGSKVEVTNRDGSQFVASRMISTIPLNVLADIEFEPKLDHLKTSAAKKGHIDLAAKVHYEVSSNFMRSWTGTAYPSKGLLYAYGDGTTPAGNTDIVGFGASAEPLDPEADVQKTKDALLHLHDVDIQRMVFHNWTKDEFAKGAWCVYSPGFATQYLAALQKPHGRIRFASADWADGWRGFIDGAMEQGRRAAFETGHADTSIRANL